MKAKKQAGIDLLNHHRAQFGNDCLTLVKDQPKIERRSWCAVILHPSTTQPDKVQRTYFDANGFSGHELFASYEEAAADSFVAGYRRADPYLLDIVSDTVQFEVGNRWSMLPDKLKWSANLEEIEAQVVNERKLMLDKR